MVCVCVVVLLNVCILHVVVQLFYVGGRVVSIASELQSVIRLLTLQRSAWRVGETQFDTCCILYALCVVHVEDWAYGLTLFTCMYITRTHAHSACTKHK